MLSTEVISETSGFRNLGPEWSELLADSPCNCFFLSWEWLYTWWLHLAGNRTLHIIVVRRDNTLIAIAPLALCPPRLERLMPFQVLEFLGSGSVGSDYLSFIVRQGHEEEAQQAIAENLDQSNHMLELTRVEQHSLAMQSMTTHMQRLDWRSSRVAITFCPYVRLDGHSWESYLLNLDHSHQKYLARKLRKLHKEFSVEFRAVDNDAERQFALDLLIRLHLAYWTERGGSTAFHSEELIDFHRSMSRISMERGWLRLYLLVLDGEPVAATYLFKYNNIFYYYQIGYNTDYARYSVGMITLALAIKSAIAEGASEFDLLHDDVAYKYLWTREKRGLLRLELYPPNALGSLYHGVIQTKAGIKQLLLNMNAYREKAE